MSATPGGTAWNKLKSHEFQHITEAYQDSLRQIDLRRRGVIKPYKSKWTLFNKTLGGGIQPSTIYVIGGRPSVGKSAFTNRLLFDMCEINDMRDTLICYWTLEMPAYQQVTRELSGHFNVSVNDLYSAEEPLPDSLFDQLVAMKDHWANKPIFLTSKSYSPDIVYKRSREIQGADTTKHIINIFDHTRLISRNQNIRSEEQLIRETMSMSRALSVELGFTNILLSQLNREIEAPHRVKEPVPQNSDFFGADAVGQFANVAIILQRPEMYRLNKYLHEPADGLLAVHVLKNRDGPVNWIPFNHELSRNHMEERYGRHPTSNIAADQKGQYGF
jgi:replicative DNA helicase